LSFRDEPLKNVTQKFIFYEKKYFSFSETLIFRAKPYGIYFIKINGSYYSIIKIINNESC